MNVPHKCEHVYLWELRLGQSRLAHLWRLAHGDVALGQWTLREGLGHQVLTGLAVRHVGLPVAVIPSATVPLTTSTTPGLTFRSTTTCKQTENRLISYSWFSSASPLVTPSIASFYISLKIANRAGWYIEFVRYINIFFISDTVWGNTIYIDIQ